MPRARRPSGLSLLAATLVACSGGASLARDASLDAPAARDAGPDAPSASDAVASDASDAAADASVQAVPWFDDVTALSIDWERVPAEGLRTFADRFSGGVCVLDADGAPPLDLFFAARGASRLFVATAPLRYADRTVDLGLDGAGDAIGCLAFDADGDGDDDLLVTRLGGAALYMREDAGFADRSELLEASFEPRGLYTSASAGDLDGDGHLDLVVAGFMRVDSDVSPAIPCGVVPCTADINRHPPIANVLLLRTRAGTYRETFELAPDLALPEPTLVVAIGDFLERGVPAIYVGNDLGGRFHDRLLERGAGGAFADVAPSAGFATNARGYGIDTMGLASGDLDRDGRLEHAVTSFESDATAIFDCEEPGVCEDRGARLGMRATKETFRWGAAFLDADLDGFVDLAEATGHYYTEAELAGLGLVGRERQRPNLLVNQGGASMAPAEPPATDGLAVERASRGIARVDLDDDGRPDLVLAPAYGPPALLRNVRAPAGRWLRVRLEGRPPNTRAVGALVTVESGSGVQSAEQRAGEGYLGSFDPRLHFGLGAAERVTIRVRWPSGVRTEAAFEPDREVVLAEP